MSRLVDDQSAFHPQPKENASLRKGESLERLLLSGGAALPGEGVQGMGAFAVDLAFYLISLFDLEYILQARQVGF